jgi:hypothetical protein
MTDEQLQDLYQQAQVRRAAEAGACDIPPETMLDVLNHKLPVAEHRRILLDIMADPHCRREFELLRAVAGKREAVTRSWVTSWPLRIAAVLVLFLGGGLLWQTLRTQPRDVVREGGDAGLVLVSPESGNTAARLFVWHSIPRAISYEYNLVTRGGRLLYNTTTRDTTAALPDSVVMKAGEDVLWWVEGTTAEGRQVRSSLRRLSIVSP